jgi:pSer/pThr/pTyr-binding forkhead associated (FHA) protein
MARLVLKYQSAVLREIPIAALPLTIGRAPDNNIRIDEPSISDHHARLSLEGEKLVIEDLRSMNGTSVNDQRVTRATLRDGDNIQIGEHILQVDTVNEASSAFPGVASPPSTTDLQSERSDDTVGHPESRSKKHGGTRARSSEKARHPLIDTAHAPRLRVLRGSTDQGEYMLLAKLTVIGSSEMAFVRLKGWFAPAVAAQINHHSDGYYLGMGDVVPEVNGHPIEGPTLLRDGDIIQLGRVRLQFSAASS